MSRPLPLLSSALALRLLSQAISYCPSWDKQVPSNEALAPGSLCPRPAGVTADLSLFGCTGLLAELGILRTQAWRHGSMAWGSLFSAAGRRTTSLRLRRRPTPAPPSLFLAALAAGRGATRAGPRWARSGSGFTTVIVPGPLRGRAGCHPRPGRDRLRRGSGPLCSPPSFAGRRAAARPTPGSRPPPGTLAGALDSSGASLRRDPAPVAAGSRVSRPGQGRREWTARGAISVRGHVTGRARAPGSPGPAPARRIARGYCAPPHHGPQSGPRFSVSIATQLGPGQLSQPVSPPPGAGLSSWAGHRAGPSLPHGSPPFRRWGTDGPQPSTPHRTRISAAGRGPDRRAGRARGLGGRAGHRTPVCDPKHKSGLARAASLATRPRRPGLVFPLLSLHLGVNADAGATKPAFRPAAPFSIRTISFSPVSCVPD